jgi:hypothetical protein
LLKRVVTENPRLTTKDLKTSYPNLLGNVAIRTIQNRLYKDLCLPSRVAAKKPLLTPKMIKKRLDFARRYSHWTPSDWEKVMWSDESTFLLVSKSAQHVRRSPSVDRFHPKYTQVTVKHSNSVMVWACFTGFKGRGSLYFLPNNTTMNGTRYIEVLQEKLLPVYHIHEAEYFMQDQAPCHRAKKAQIG